ncbi:hypothetical protein V8E52_003838 [Russula decolorans]
MLASVPCQPLFCQPFAEEASCKDGGLPQSVTIQLPSLGNTIYSLTRVATLLAVILNMIGFNTTTPMHCQLFAHIAFAAASLLIVIRVYVPDADDQPPKPRHLRKLGRIAIWNTEKIIIIIAMSVWLINISLLIEGIVRIRSAWSPEATTCTLLNLETNKPAVISTLATDVVLLLIMIIGLLRMHLEVVCLFDLGRVLWKQGLIWLIVATLAVVPPTAPNMIVMAIAATKMYRSVDNLVSPRETPRGPKRTVLSDMRVRTEYGQYPTSQSGSGSCISTDPQERYRAHEVSFNVDIESCLEK